ncbi:MAG: energy transducer TonB [Planctomycetota bacterium]
MEELGRTPFLARITDRVLGTLGAVVLTLAFFLVLPLMQAIAQSNERLYRTDEVESVAQPTIDDVVEEPQQEQEQEPEPPEEQPQDDFPDIDLANLEVAMSAAGSGLYGGGDFGLDFGALASSIADDDATVSFTDLDQPPRLTNPENPDLGPKLLKRVPATVVIAFDVDVRGRVKNPVVLDSTDPAFDKAAVEAVKKWRFDPARKDGEPVAFRMKVPMTFPESLKK